MFQNKKLHIMNKNDAQTKYIFNDVKQYELLYLYLPKIICEYSIHKYEYEIRIFEYPFASYLS